MPGERMGVFLQALTLASTLALFFPREAFCSGQQEAKPAVEAKINLLKLLNINPSAESVDYVQYKTQFQLHSLLTEQRHPRTWKLSQKIKESSTAGLHMLLSVDEDITKKLESLAQDKEPLEQAVGAIEKALLSGSKVYIYGCGATGRLAKQMESTFWRPFWRKASNYPRIWEKITPHLGTGIEERLIGEMTGADRALISSLEGFEDLQLIGRLQLEDRGIKKGDVVICVTEGGETSSVIGTILAALDQWKTGSRYYPQEARQYLYFVYNNPDERLLPFERSQRVLEDPGITKINLTTGPQAITGSTRMQATTIETFVVANLLQAAAERMLGRFLSKKDLARLGFEREIRLEEKLLEFDRIQRQVSKAVPSLTEFTRLEAETYESGRFSTYLAQKGLITVFIDSTERSPTFRLFPLDTVREKERKCWIQVWTPARSLEEAWQAFLGRAFRGLNPRLYQKPFEEEITDPYLKRAALESLKNAGDDQQFLYDFSLSNFNLQNRGPKPGDLGVCVAVGPEENLLEDKDSEFRNFIKLFSGQGARVVLLMVTNKTEKEALRLSQSIPELSQAGKSCQVVVPLGTKNDPFGISHQAALKIILNAHSTAVMARLGKVVGNTMTNVSPSNLKLIGRATYLIQSHVNDILSQPEWVKNYGLRTPVSYGEANAVLFEAIGFLKDKKTMAGQTAEVALSIIRILESLRLKRGLTQEEAFSLVKEKGLSQYLAEVISRPESGQKS